MSAPGLKITNPHYANMRMPEPDESIRDWPKWVHMKGYPSVVVQNAEEEAKMLARPARDASEAPKPVAPIPRAEPLVNPTKAGAAVMEPPRTLAGPNEEREILFQIASEKNIKVDKRWKTDRLRATIERGTSQ